MAAGLLSPSRMEEMVERPAVMEEMEERLAVTKPDGGDANDRGLREMEWDEWTKNGVKDGG